MLKPLQEPTKPVEVGSDSPTVVCEACQKPGPSHLMINVMIVVGSPGHPALLPFQCSNTEHWACSPECWKIVAHACIDEHMHELLKAARATVGL